MPTRSRDPWSWCSSLVGLAALGLVGFGGTGCERETRAPTDEPAPPACTGLDGFAAVWNPERRRALEAALGEQPGGWSEQLLASLDADLAVLGQRWLDMRSEVCVRAPDSSQTSSTLGRSCLDAQVWELDAVITLILEQPARASSLWARLDYGDVDPRVCAAATIAGVPLSAAQGRELASVTLLVELEEFEPARARIVALAADPAIRDSPTHALSLSLARVAVTIAAGQLESAVGALTDAERLASGLDAGARARVAAADASLAIARQDPVAAARAQLRAVELARESGDAWLLVTQLDALGRGQLDRGEPLLAIDAWVEAIGLLGRVAGPDNPRTAVVQRSLAAAQLELGRVEAAHDALTQARDTLVIALGPDHPQTLATVEDIGRLFVDAGRAGDAQFAFLDLLEVYTDLYGVKDWRTARIKLELADSLMAVEQHASAQVLYTEALTPLAQALGPTHPEVVRASIHLGLAELALGRPEAAQPHCRRGRDLAGGLGVEHPLVAEADDCLARIGKAPKAAGRRSAR